MAFWIPRQNLFSHQLHPTGSTNDLLLFDSALFDGLQLPEGVDKKLVVNCILERHGNAALAHPDPEWMRHYIGTWSARRLPIWEKLEATLHLEYNPIENYDRKEDIEEKRVIGRTTSSSANGTNSENLSETSSGTSSGETSETGSEDTTGETKRDVSAENATDYQADTKDTNTITVGRKTDGTSSTETSQESSSDRSSSMATETSGAENTTDTFTHSNRTHGNIGVTTSQQMIQSERDLVRYSLIEEIAEDYRDAFCLDVY